MPKSGIHSEKQKISREFTVKLSPFPVVSPVKRSFSNQNLSDNLLSPETVVPLPRPTLMSEISNKNAESGTPLAFNRSNKRPFLLNDEPSEDFSQKRKKNSFLDPDDNDDELTEFRPTGTKSTKRSTRVLDNSFRSNKRVKNNEILSSYSSNSDYHRQNLNKRKFSPDLAVVSELPKNKKRTYIQELELLTSDNSPYYKDVYNTSSTDQKNSTKVSNILSTSDIELTPEVIDDSEMVNVSGDSTKPVEAVLEEQTNEEVNATEPEESVFYPLPMHVYTAKDQEFDKKKTKNRLDRFLAAFKQANDEDAEATKDVSDCSKATIELKALSSATSTNTTTISIANPVVTRGLKFDTTTSKPNHTTTAPPSVITLATSSSTSNIPVASSLTKTISFAAPATSTTTFASPSNPISFASPKPTSTALVEAKPASTLNFGSTTNQASTSISFGTPSTVSSAPKPALTFGSTEVKTANPISFGSVSSTETKTSNQISFGATDTKTLNPISFGSVSSTETKTLNPISFGTTQSVPSTTINPKPAIFRSAEAPKLTVSSTPAAALPNATFTFGSASNDPRLKPLVPSSDTSASFTLKTSNSFTSQPSRTPASSNPNASFVFGASSQQPTPASVSGPVVSPPSSQPAAPSMPSAANLFAFGQNKQPSQQSTANPIDFKFVKPISLPTSSSNSSNMFNFNSTAKPTGSVPNFNPTSTPSSGFNFAATSAAPAANMFSFTANPTTPAPAAPNKGFNFQPNTAISFNFNASTPSTTPAAAASNSGFQFNANTTTSNGFNFSQSATSTPKPNQSFSFR